MSVGPAVEGLLKPFLRALFRISEPGARRAWGPPEARASLLFSGRRQGSSREEVAFSQEPSCWPNKGTKSEKPHLLKHPRNAWCVRHRPEGSTAPLCWGGGHASRPSLCPWSPPNTYRLPAVLVAWTPDATPQRELWALVGVGVSICASVCTCLRVCLCVSGCGSVFTRLCVWVYVICVYLCLCLCLCVTVCILVSVYLCLCVCVHL